MANFRIWLIVPGSDVNIVALAFAREVGRSIQDMIGYIGMSTLCTHLNSFMIAN